MAFPDLLVGTESSDDAAVYRINETQAIVATTDFFMPIVDDAVDFGRIAATNALSDVYAMGAKPLMALAIVGMPIDKMPVATIRDILKGGESVCSEVGIPIAGGHSIDSPEPIYGLVVLGIIDPKKIKRNDQAKAGDVIILGKGLGVGILSAALKKGQLDEAGYQEMIATTTKLNTPGSVLAEMPEVHALTDVTGFALLGHLLEICRGSQLAAELEFKNIPLLPHAVELAQQGYVPGAAGRNWASYGEFITMPDDLEDWKRMLLCDPQTSGGLLVTCSQQATDQVLAVFRAEGFAQAAAIGRMVPGPSEIKVLKP